MASIVNDADFMTIPLANPSANSTTNTELNQQTTGFKIERLIESDTSTRVTVTNIGNNTGSKVSLALRLVSKTNYGGSVNVVKSNQVRVDGSQKKGAVNLEVEDGSTTPAYNQLVKIGASFTAIDVVNTK
jgi:hypothetical protein